MFMLIGLCCVQFLYNTVCGMGAGLNSDFSAVSVLSANEVQSGELGGQASWLYRQMVQVLRR